LVWRNRAGLLSTMVSRVLELLSVHGALFFLGRGSDARIAFLGSSPVCLLSYTWSSYTTNERVFLAGPPTTGPLQSVEGPPPASGLKVVWDSLRYTPVVRLSRSVNPVFLDLGGWFPPIFIPKLRRVSSFSFASLFGQLCPPHGILKWTVPVSCFNLPFPFSYRRQTFFMGVFSYLYLGPLLPPPFLF